MAQRNIQTWRKEPLYYCLFFKNTITSPAGNLEELVLKQGVGVEVEEGQNLYTLTLNWVKVNKKLYQPVEIEAELFFMQITTAPTTTAPSFYAVTDLLLQRQVELTFDDTKKSYTIAKNCYVFEVRPQLKQDVNGTTMVVKLRIFSMDKLMTLNKYSKAYVTRKLGSGILRPESLNFGLKADKKSPLIETKVATLSHLGYGDDAKEFIQPYLVQYNESFYDFLKRTSSRCGEFLYFEDGKLTLGLVNTGEAEILKGYASVTMSEVAADPLEIKDYARDSMKDGSKVGELNYSVIEKQSTGFPKDAFPSGLSANAELSSDEFFFPLVADKFTNRNREASYNNPIFKGMSSLKKATMSGGAIDAILQVGLQEGILSVTSTLTTNGINGASKKAIDDAAKAMPEQAQGGKMVPFGTLDEKGWTTIDYYNDIHRHQHDLERQTICIDMGTTLAEVKLGQKIKIDALPDNYIITGILDSSEESDGQRQMTIYAIPTLKEGNTETYFPPVQAVPIIRKSGPQTAFVVDNDDPKYQGRVRVAYPWQSIKEDLKNLLAEKSEMLKKKRAEREKLTGGMKQKKLKVWNSVEELYALRDYLLASPAERAVIKAAMAASIEALRADVEKLKFQKKNEEDGVKIILKEQFYSRVDYEIKQENIRNYDAKIKKQEDKIASMVYQLGAMERCAKEHDENKDKKGYKLEETNKEVQKEVAKFDKLYDTDYDQTIKKSKELEKEEKELAKQEEAIQKVLSKEIKEVSTPWIRIASPMATPGGGAFFKPRVGDEVLINYDNDNVERPYVVGSLFSKNTLEPGESLERASGAFLHMGKQVSMSIVSPNGHHITFSDPPDGKKFLFNMNPGASFISSLIPMKFNIPNTKELAGGIHIGDRYGIYEIEMNTHERAVSIKSPLGTVDISAFTGITINAPNGDVNIKGKNVNIEAGNKVTITSGMNIAPPDIGQPDYTCGSPVLQQMKGWRGVGTFFANIGRIFRTGGAWLGHNLFQYIPMALTDQVAGGLADLSLLRHTVEIIVRPIDGTTLIKSKRYLMLEAGNGKAKIKSDRFAESKVGELDSMEKFYIKLIKVLKDTNDKITSYYSAYKILWQNATNLQSHFVVYIDDNMKKANLKDYTKIFYSMEKFDKSKVGEPSNLFKDEDFNQFWYQNGDKWYKTHEERRDFLYEKLLEYGKAIVALHSFAIKFENILDDFSDDNMFEKAAKEAFKKFAKEDQKKWVAKYGENEPSSDFAGWGEEVYTKEDVQALLKRKTAALYLVNVAKDEEVKKNKLFEIGFDESDIVDKKLNKDYNWKNFMTHFDRKTSHGNMWRIYALEWFWEPIKKRFWDSLGTLPEIFIWRDEHGHDGQILFSDNDGATLHIEGEGLKSETQSNLGNRDQLVKLLLSIK